MLKFVIIAYRNIYRNKRRSILSIAAIAVAVFFIIVLMGLIDGMIGSMEETVKTFETGDLSLYHEKFENKQEFLPLQYPLDTDGRNIEDFINQVKKIEGVKAVLPRIASYATLTDNLVKHALIWGIHFETENEINVFNRLYKRTEKRNGLMSGRFPERNQKGKYKNECIIGKSLAKKMNVKIGDKIPLKIISSQYSDKFYRPTIVGLFDYNYESYNTNFIIIPFEKMQRLATLKGKTQKLLIYLDHEKYLNSVYKELAKTIKNTPSVLKTWKQHSYIAMMDQYTIVYYVIYGIFIVVASFLIINTMIMVIHERIKEIGMMGALGMQREEIMMVFFLEALFLSVIGAFFGAALGGLFTFFFSFYPFNVLNMTGGMDIPMGNIIYFKFTLDYLVTGFVFGVIVSGFCTLFPSLKSAFIKPVEALRR